MLNYAQSMTAAVSYLKRCLSVFEHHKRHTIACKNDCPKHTTDETLHHDIVFAIEIAIDARPT